MEIAQHHQLIVIEDAAQGVGSAYKGQALGSIGHLAAVSFHETKNVICGEGGALLLNTPAWIERTEIIWEKGTNRNQFFQGQVDKYTWVDIGSSYLPSEINAAFLWAQLEEAEAITQKRIDIWKEYHQAFAELEAQGKVRRPIIPDECQHNAHMYYLLLPDLDSRTVLIEKLKICGVYPVFHYVPLHSSPAGRKYGRTHGSLSSTDELSDRLVRLPLWIGMENKMEQIIKLVSIAVN
jgi:dTDP-4-amino-4,6-dideoxygalactose transaminase